MPHLPIREEAPDLAVESLVRIPGRTSPSRVAEHKQRSPRHGIGGIVDRTRQGYDQKTFGASDRERITHPSEASFHHAQEGPKLTASQITSIEANDLSVRSFKQGYALGREAGLAEMQVRVECLELLVDHWYYIANNPGAVAEERQRNLSFVELREVREQRETQRQEWDAQEQLTFDMARTMIDEGRSDREVAVALGLFLPLVANLRAGAL